MTAWMGQVGTEVVWLAVGAGFALLAATWHATGSFLDRPVPAWRIVSGPALGLALVAALAGLPLLAADVRLGLTTAAVVGLVGPLLFGPAVAIAGSACAFTAVRREGARSQWPVALGAAAPLWIAAAAVVWGGLAASDPLFAVARAAVYGVLSLLVAAVAVGARIGAADAAVGGAAMGPVAVALGEASQRGLVVLLVVLQRDAVAADRWGAAVDQMVAHVRPEWIASWVALAAAAACPAVPALAARRWGLASVAAAVTALGALTLLAVEAAVVRLPLLGR